MPDALLNSPPPAETGKAAADLADWLGGLLDMARNRDDAPLARLIAGVVDDLKAAGG